MFSKKKRFFVFLLILVYSCVLTSCSQIVPDEVFLVAVVENDIAQRVDTIYVKEGERFAVFPVIRYKGV